jgi:hypothetical protein
MKTFISSILLLLFAVPVQVQALEIILTSPVPQTASDKVRVSDISDHPDRRQLSFRLSIGYTNPDGQWVEVKDHHELIQNLPAVSDNPATPENEAQPAKPLYDNLQNLLKASGKTAEEVILNRAKTKYPGTIQ